MAQKEKAITLPILPACGNCRFFFEQGYVHNGGLCRLRPPSVIVVPPDENHSADVRTVWPEVTKGDWCAEYRREL